MLKDMADSKRIDDRIHGDVKVRLHFAALTLQSSLHPLIISHRFWPPVPASSLHLTPKLQAAQEAYEHAFHRFKPDKHLRFYQQLGTARLRLELQDRVVEVEATALQAAVVESMEGVESATIEEVADKLDVSEMDVRGAMMFWAGEGVLGEQAGVWKVLEKIE